MSDHTTTAILETCATCFLPIAMGAPRLHLHGRVHHVHCGSPTRFTVAPTPSEIDAALRWLDGGYRLPETRAAVETLRYALEARDAQIARLRGDS